MKKFLLAIAAVALSMSASAATVYLMGDCTSWPSTAAPAESEDGVYVWTDVVMPNADNWFAFTEAPFDVVEAADWGEINAMRYAPDPDAGEADEEIGVSNVIIEVGRPSAVVYGQDASWQIVGGTYDLYLDTNEMQLLVTLPGAALDTVEAANNVEAVYYNLQGVRINNPENGVFVKVAGKKATKVVF